MKKKYLGLLKTIEDDSPLMGGLARSTYASVTSYSSGNSLTLKNLEKMYKYLNSKKYQKRVEEQQRIYAGGLKIIGKALEQEIITTQEYYRLRMSMSINGALIVSPDMYKRLEKVKAE